MLLNDTQLDILKELVNIGVGRAAAMLNEMLMSEIKLQVPNTILTDCTNVHNILAQSSDEKISSIEFEFSGNFSGVLKLLFKKEKASELVARLTGEELGTYELDSVSVGTLTEVGNIILNSIIGSFGNLMTSQFDFSLPNFQENHIKNLMCFKGTNEEPHILLNNIEFGIEELVIESAVLLIVDSESLEQLKFTLNSF